MKMRTLFLFFLMAVSLITRAQTLLSVDDAVGIALKNNFDILVSHNDVDIAKTNNTPGNAGMLPNVGISASGSYAIKDVHQELSSGTINNYPTLGTTIWGAEAELSWTLYDGGKMFVTKEKLNEIEKLGQIQFKAQVQQVVADVISAYFNIVKQKQQLASINQTISYNVERVRIAQTAFDAGSVKKTDLLQAKIDLNVYKENAITQQTAILEAKRELQALLSIDSGTLIEVSDSIEFSYTPNKEEIQQKLYLNNLSILAYQKQMDIEKLLLKEKYCAQLPQIDFTTGYAYSRTANTDGTTLLNRGGGPQIGGAVSIPVFQSGSLKRQISLAKIDVLSAQFNFENVKLKMDISLRNALNSFDDQQQLLQIEKENFSLARENLEICLQRMRLGEATSLEVHLAQQEFVQSSTRLINFEYNLKLAETKLKQLVGDL